MTDEQKKTIKKMRDECKGYTEIANAIGSNKNTVKTYCRRNGLAGRKTPVVDKSKTCQWCGKDFETDHPARQKYCSTSCAGKAVGEKQRKYDDPNKAKRVGQLRHYYKHREEIRAKAKEEYKKIAKRRVVICDVCGGEYETSHKSGRFCSEECRRQFNLKPKFKTICKCCGKTFKTSRPNARYCSAKCRKKTANRAKEKRLRKVIKSSAEIISLERLYKRDKGICHICGEKCDWKDKEISGSGHFIVGDRYPSKDHLLPISRGGKESWSNLKLAHMKCNCEKSNNVVYFGPDGQGRLAL